MPQLNGGGGDDLGANDEMISFKDEGEQEEKISENSSAERDLADVKSSLVNESETNQNSSSDSEAERRPPPRSETFRDKTRESLEEAAKRQDGGLFKSPPYPGYPFIMIPDLTSPYLPNGSLSPTARTVFVFDVGGKTWKSYNWSMVTTVAAFGNYDAELMCFAHSKGARVVLKGDVHIPYIVDQANRTKWITEQVSLAKKQFMDGINIDVEQAVEDGSPEYYALTALVNESTETFHREIPGSQVSFDVAWSPKCIDKRCYDYVTIAKSCDLVFVMSYDEQSQITGDCIAMANAPFSQTLKAYDDYLDLKIHSNKLLMGVPWYGYDYPCVNLSQEGICYIPKVPFRGAPCSDAAGKQKTYKWIMKQLNSPTSSGRLWDDEQKAPYFYYKDETGQSHQVWYDDPQSLSPKADYVMSKGLRGIGMWNGNILDYSDDPVARQQTALMWNALLGSKLG